MQLPGLKTGDFQRFFDMHGNVPQWTRDGYDRSYQVSDITQSNPNRVVRGGAFSMGAKDTRCAKRFRFDPGTRNSATRMAPPIGFRVVIQAREQ